MKSLFGISQLRCRRCRARWETSVWHEGAWRYARCPRCYRQDLSTWSEHYYRPPGWTAFLLRVGATPYRCAACRLNFASFKPCKEKFSWRHETKVEAGGAPAGDQVRETASAGAGDRRRYERRRQTNGGPTS